MMSGWQREFNSAEQSRSQLEKKTEKSVREAFQYGRKWREGPRRCPDKVLLGMIGYSEQRASQLAMTLGLGSF